jgi:hypothetical protein
MFVAPPPDEDAPEGYDLLVSDSSQLELRLGAFFTRDPTLLKVYQESVTLNGVTFYTGDPHAETAKRMNVPRKLAKNLNFGLMYGMSASSFARYAKIYLPGTKNYDERTASVYVEKFRDTYCGVFDYHRRLSNAWHQGQRLFPTISGRMRHFPRGIRISPGTVYNSRIQGSAGDIIKAQLWAISKFLLPHFPGVKVLIQVHDELLLECPRRFSAQVAVLKKFLMEYRWFDVDVPLLASSKICQSWAAKDDDDVPEVGTFYARIKSDRDAQEIDSTFTSKTWPQYRAIEKEKRVVKKAAVAMLTPKQIAWADTFLPPEMPRVPLFGSTRKSERLLTPEEYRAKREAQKAEED